MKNTTLLSRFAQGSLLAVLLFLAAFSIWTALLDQQAARQVEIRNSLDNLDRQITSTFAQEGILLHDYLLEPSASVRDDYMAMATALPPLLQHMQQNEDADGRALVSTLFAEQQRYLFFAGQLFAAIDAHNPSLAKKLHSSEIDPLFGHIQAQLRTDADTDQTRGNQAMAQLARTQSIILVTTPIAFAIGLLLMTISWRVTVTYRRKIDETTRAELGRLEHLAFTDPLTHLGNHYAYQEHLTQAVQESRHTAEPLILALLDLDEFKVINDEQGHQRGDEVLCDLAALLEESKLSEALFRLSADQFAIIVPHTSLAEITVALERLREDVQRRLSGATVSIGIAHTTSHEFTRELLQTQASVALAEAKRRGRNRVVAFAGIAGSVSVMDLAKTQAARRLLNEGKITIAFQPIWNLTSGTAQAFEALTRPDASYGFSGPQELFDVVEQIGRAHELDLICIQAILARAAELPPDALLFLNLSPQTFVHDLLTEAVLLEAVVRAGLEPSRVVLEITERAIVNLAQVVEKARFLRMLGFRIALDDAGAGNAGLEMLSQLPVDFVKVDRAIVSQALTDQAARSVFVGLTTIARELEIAVVAEGIENAEMLDFVQRARVHYAQGYLLGRPSETIPEPAALQKASPFQPTTLQLA